MSDFSKLLYTRRSVRRFESKAVEKEKVDLLLKSALLAPSGKSTYPCQFIAVDDTAVLKSIAEAKQHGSKLVGGAPLAIVIAVDTSIYDVWVEDASIASTYVMLMAENLGLGCCWVQMHLRATADGKSAADNLRDTLNLPDNYDILSVLAVGYASDSKPAYTDADLKTDKVHLNRIGNNYNL